MDETKHGSRPNPSNGRPHRPADLILMGGLLTGLAVIGQRLALWLSVG